MITRRRWCLVMTVEISGRQARRGESLSSPLVRAKFRPSSPVQMLRTKNTTLRHSRGACQFEPEVYLAQNLTTT